MSAFSINIESNPNSNEKEMIGSHSGSKTVKDDEETDLKDDGDEFKAGIDLINFGMPR
jgi:hypothetical protein